MVYTLAIPVNALFAHLFAYPAQMLTADVDDCEDGAESRLPSALAQSFKSVCRTWTTRLASGAARSDDLNARLGEMHSVFVHSVSDVLREWNRTHDLLGVLPVELRGLCWSYLPQADRVRLARVCSSWCSLSRSIPALWASIAVSGSLRGLEALLARSAELPLDVSVVVFDAAEHGHVEGCLRKHAHRLCSLRIVDKDIPFEGRTRGHTLFRYHAPALEHFALELLNPDDGFVIAPDLLNRSAPSLRSVELHQLPIPGHCPAFSRISSLVIKWCLDFGMLRGGGLEHLFSVAPGLERLELLNIRVSALPSVPAVCPLRTMKLTCHRPSFSTLLARGYIGLPELDVANSIVQSDAETLCRAGLDAPPALDTTLSISCTGRAQVILCGPGGSKATFSGEPYAGSTLDDLLRAAASFATLTRLELPSAVLRARVPEYPYLPDGALRLPALRTLVIAHGAAGVCVLFDARGMLVTPLLSRVELLRGEACGRAAAPLAPRALAQFLAEHVVCDAPGELTLVVSAPPEGLLDLGDAAGMLCLSQRIGSVVC